MSIQDQIENERGNVYLQTLCLWCDMFIF